MSNSKKKIIIIGAGPGGLTAGMILANQGFDVHIYEKNNYIGGRNAHLDIDGFKFDVGPTFLMMKFLLDEVFEKTGRKSSDYLKFTSLSPMYRLIFKDKQLDIFNDIKKMKQIIKEISEEDAKGYDRFIKIEKKRFDRMYPCLERPYDSIASLFNKDLLKALPSLQLNKSMYDVLKNYFNNEELRIGFTFQSKYLGMSPWSCPAAFMIIPYIEHAFGIYHVEGGLSQISEAMARVIKEDGGVIHFNKVVKKVITENKKVKGVMFDDKTKDMADEVILNADFAYAMTNIFDPEDVKKYSQEKLAKKKYSCSTFMLYLGLDKVYDLPHHSIVFSNDYESYIKNVSQHKEPDKDISFYIRNASINDQTIAPQGMSNIYILVPVSNKKSNYDWQKNKQKFRDLVIEQIKTRLDIKDFDQHIVTEKIITPDDWQRDYNVYLGATFNLGHNVMQMLYFRPHNKFECVDNCYLVGGGTHPGSGLPTIYQSGIIAADLIIKKYS